jgi:hypothetical protein
MLPSLQYVPLSSAFLFDYLLHDQYSKSYVIEGIEQTKESWIYRCRAAYLYTDNQRNSNKIKPAIPYLVALSRRRNPKRILHTLEGESRGTRLLITVKWRKYVGGRTWPYVWLSASNTRLKFGFCCGRTRPNWVRSGKTPRAHNKRLLDTLYDMHLDNSVNQSVCIRRSLSHTIYMQFAAVTAHNPNSGALFFFYLPT